MHITSKYRKEIMHMTYYLSSMIVTVDTEISITTYCSGLMTSTVTSTTTRGSLDAKTATVSAVSKAGDGTDRLSFDSSVGQTGAVVDITTLLVNLTISPISTGR